MDPTRRAGSTVSPPRFSVSQPVLVNLVFVILIIFGVQTARRIPVDVFPDISFNTAMIITPWFGASPGEVERLVTTKIEDEIEGITGIKEMTSFSTYGLSEINVEWDETLSQAEADAAFNDLRVAIDRVTDLPVNADTPWVREITISEVYHVAMIAVSDVGGVGESAILEVAEDLKRRLERIPGLRRAELRGERDRELRIIVDRERALQYDLTLTEISQVITRNNRNFAGGSFTNPNLGEITVRGIGQYATPEAISRTVVGKNSDGTHIRLADLAQVEKGFEEKRLSARLNGKSTILLGIAKEPDHDVIVLMEEVRAYLDTYRPLLPPGIEIAVPLDDSRYVEARIGVMVSNLLLGVVFVVFLLWLTVGFRNAFVAIIGVPFAFLVAMTLFPVFDITINSLSLVGFVMVSGMLVDDAIILVENIYRHVESGKEIRQAVIDGAEEVMWPVTAAILTTAAAFIPMLTVSGTSGAFMSILPKTVVVCLLGSLFEAMLILPVHYLDWGSREALAKDRNESHWTARFHAMRLRSDRFLAELRERYLASQQWLLPERRLFLAACVGAFLFATALFLRVPVDLFPSDFNSIFVTVKTSKDAGFDTTDSIVAGIEDALAELGDEITDISTNIGLGMTSDERPVLGVNWAVLYLTFPQNAANVADPERILNLVRSQLDRHQSQHRDLIESLLVATPRNGPPIGKPVAVRIQSEDYEEAKRIAAEMKAELTRLPGVYNIEDNVPVGPREMRVSLNENRASLHGLTFQEIGLALTAANEGVISSSYRPLNESDDIDIRVLLEEEDRDSIRDLMNIELRARDGYLVQLGDVADLKLERGFQRLYHFDARRTVVVYADVDNEAATSVSVNQHLQKTFAHIPESYPGVNLVFGGEFQATDDAFADMGRAFLLAVLAIYAILATQFRSYTQPFIVMSVIAFSFTGVTVGLFLLSLVWSGYALSMYVLYAVVGLAGIVVNDSLVLIDFINRERARGLSAHEAVVSGCDKRFRPIMLTTLTTITGLLPMAIGLSGYSTIFSPFAASIVCGLAVASLLTLYVVPMLYLSLEDLHLRITRFRQVPPSV
jgi:HAE1 family hydrophobic/amphiphilic exporter-1